MRVTESMGPAWETMKRILFRPFNFGTWFSFGFVFFLQSCMEGGGGGGNFLNLPGNNHGSGHDGSSGGDTGNNLAGIAHDLLQSGDSATSTMLPIIILVVAFAVAIPVVILMYWLGTRGQMMAIRSVAIGQATLGEQWSATRDAASMLFKFQLAMAGISLVIFLPLIAGAGVIALPTIRDKTPIEDVLPALIAVGAVAILALIPFAIVGAMARNFVAPIMLKHGIGAREAWKRFWAVGRNHLGGIFIFYVMRILVGLGAGIVGVIAGVFTCCLGFLPILHQTVMAPYYVFERAWTLEVLASMSPDFDVRGAGPPPPPMPYVYGGGDGTNNPYVASATDNPYAPPGYGR